MRHQDSIRVAVAGLLLLERQRELFVRMAVREALQTV